MSRRTATTAHCYLHYVGDPPAAAAPGTRGALRPHRQRNRLKSFLPRHFLALSLWRTTHARTQMSLKEGGPFAFPPQPRAHMSAAPRIELVVNTTTHVAATPSAEIRRAIRHREGAGRATDTKAIAHDTTSRRRHGDRHRSKACPAGPRERCASKPEHLEKGLLSNSVG